MTKIHSEGLRDPSVVAGPGVAYPSAPPLDGPIQKRGQRTGYKCLANIYSLELRPKTIVKLSGVRTNEGRLFQTVGAKHENRRAAMFVDEDCVDSRSDVDDPRKHATVYVARLDK